MKTAQEKAQEWLNENIALWSVGQLNALTTLLKEQDRDTRHACAEAVIQHGGAPALEMIDMCHVACMNARAV